MERVQARMERLERQMRERIEEVHKQYRRDLVLWRPETQPVRRAR